MILDTNAVSDAIAGNQQLLAVLKEGQTPSIPIQVVGIDSVF